MPRFALISPVMKCCAGVRYPGIIVPKSWFGIGVDGMTGGGTAGLPYVYTAACWSDACGASLGRNSAACALIVFGFGMYEAG